MAFNKTLTAVAVAASMGLSAPVFAQSPKVQLLAHQYQLVQNKLLQE